MTAIGGKTAPWMARQQNTIMTTTSGRTNVASAGRPQGTAVASTATRMETLGRIALIAGPTPPAVPQSGYPRRHA